MTARDLQDEVDFDLLQMQTAVDELRAIRNDVTKREPTLRERVAAGSFLMQFYNGVENILKRVSAYHDVPLPTGRRWHTDLFLRFCDPPHGPLPRLFDAALQNAMRPYRTFRHIARTSYGIELAWSKVIIGIDEIGPVFERFRAAITDYLNRLD